MKKLRSKTRRITYLFAGLLVTMVCTLVLSGCGNDLCVAGIGDCDMSAPTLTATASPTSITNADGVTSTITALGGTPPYTFSIQTSNAGTIALDPVNAAKALFTPSGSFTSTATIQVSDSAATTVSVTVTVTSS